MASHRTGGRPLSLRLKITLVSLLSLAVTTACSLLRLRSDTGPQVTCYTAVASPEPPTPEVMCYEVAAPTQIPSPFVTCYTAPPPTMTATPTPPTSPLATPTATATAEARRLLLDQLLADGRFPARVVEQLDDSAGS